MSCSVILASLLNQDVNESSPRPEPIDDTAGMRAAPPGGEAPCAVQVRSRYGARGLLVLTLLVLMVRLMPLVVLSRPLVRVLCGCKPLGQLLTL